MTSSQDNRAKKGLSCIGFNTDNFIVFQDQSIHTGFEMNFTATTDDLLTDIFYHTGQFICSDMRMGICQDRGAGTMLTKNIQNLIH